MKAADIQADTYYAVRLGRITFTGRVDAIMEPVHDWLSPRYVVFLCEPDLRLWRTLPPSAILYETRPPEQMAAIADAKHVTWREGYRERMAVRKAAVGVAADIERLPHQEPVVHKQGSVFHAGDFGGIT